MKLTVHSDHGDVLRLHMKGPIAMNVPGEEREAIAELLDDRGYARRVLMNLGETKFIDSSGLSWLLVSHNRFHKAKGKLVFHSVPTSVLEVLKVMRLDRVLHVAEDEAAALVMVQGDEP